MARRNIYLTDDLDKRVRAAIDAGQLDASDVCATALGHALNGHPAAVAEATGHQHQGSEAGRRLDAIERKLGQLATMVSIMVLVVAAGVLVVYVRSSATS